MMQDGRWKNSGHIWERRPSPVLPLRIGRGWKASERKELEAGPPDTISRARPALLSCSRKCTNTSSALGGMASYTAWDRPALAPGTQNPKPGRAGSPPLALRTPSPGGPGPEVPCSVICHVSGGAGLGILALLGCFPGGFFYCVHDVSSTLAAKHRSTLSNNYLEILWDPDSQRFSLLL